MKRVVNEKVNKRVPAEKVRYENVVDLNDGSDVESNISSGELLSQAPSGSESVSLPDRAHPINGKQDSEMF